jgi:hypothetical protein
MEGIVLQTKRGSQVREDALRMARWKLGDGCTPCAQKYAVVAAQHGATRRDFMRRGLGAVAAVVGAGALVTMTMKDVHAKDCFYDWQCVFGHYMVAQRCCDYVYVFPVGVVYECWIESVNNTGWNC